MDHRGSIIGTVDARLRIYPSQQFIAFLNSLPHDEDIPASILKVIGRNSNSKSDKCNGKLNISLNDDDMRNMKKLHTFVGKNRLSEGEEKTGEHSLSQDRSKKTSSENLNGTSINRSSKNIAEKVHGAVKKGHIPEKEIKQKYFNHFLTTSDVDWIYSYLQDKVTGTDEVPYLHTLLEGAYIQMPENKAIERNPELELRCAKLKAEQEGKEFTSSALQITVDNLKSTMTRLEDNIAYEKCKQLHGPLLDWRKYIHRRSKGGKKEHQD